MVGGPSTTPAPCRLCSADKRWSRMTRSLASASEPPGALVCEAVRSSARSSSSYTSRLTTGMPSFQSSTLRLRSTLSEKPWQKRGTATGGSQLSSATISLMSATCPHDTTRHVRSCCSRTAARMASALALLSLSLQPLLDAAGAAEYKEFDGAQDHDLLLRLTEKAARIEHIKKVLYIWRGHAGSTAAGMEAKPYALEAGVRAIDAQLQRLGMPGKAENVPGAPGAFQVRYELTGHPLVSVLIPNKDHTDDLERCLSSLYKNAGYDNFEVLVIENNSTDPATEDYYKTLPHRYQNCRVVRYQGPFNFSAINNFGAARAKGEHLLLLNNDIEVLSHDFLRELLSYSQRADVGAVGAKLYYPDDTIQHAGVIMGINGSAGHSHKSYPRKAVGDLYRLVTTQNYMAVTGACLMTKADLYRQAGGLDEENFAVAYNDVDYCLKLWQQGLLNVFTPRAEAYHYESKSRGLDTLSENARRYEREKAAFYAKYKAYIDHYDPYYNPHFNNLFENFGLK